MKKCQFFVALSVLTVGLLGFYFKRKTPSIALKEKRLEVFNFEDYYRSTQPVGRHGGTLIASIEQEPKTFHPLNCIDGHSASAQKLLFAGLLEYNYEQQTLVPALAKSYEILDDCTYRFHLRRGLQWNDGSPFSMEDVLFTLDIIFQKEDDRWVFPNTLVDKFVYQGKVLQYRCLDDWTIEFKTPFAWASFLEDLSTVYILPKHCLDKFRQDKTLLQQWSLKTAIKEPLSIVGMGPFRIQSFRPGERLILEANPYYWKIDAANQRLPYLEKYITQYVANTTVRTLLFGSGQTDLAPIGPADVAWIRERASRYNFSVYDRGPEIKFTFFWFNLQRGEDGESFVPAYKLRWFQNVKFRQAILYGLDRQGMVDAIYLGYGEVLHSFIHRLDARWYNPNCLRYDYNPVKARVLLSEAGFVWDKEGNLCDDQGNRVCFDTLWSTSGADGLITTLQENLAQLGIEVRIVNLEFKALLETIQHKYNYDSAIVGFRFGQSDPNDFLPALRSSGNLHFWWPNQQTPKTAWEAQVDRLLEKQAGLLDIRERKPYWDQIQYIYSEQVPWMPLTSSWHFTGIKNKWKNLRIPPKGSIVWNIEEIWEDS